MIPDIVCIWVSFFLAQRPTTPILHPLPGVILLGAMRGKIHPENAVVIEQHRIAVSGLGITVEEDRRCQSRLIHHRRRLIREPLHFKLAQLLIGKIQNCLPVGDGQQMATGAEVDCQMLGHAE
jgi:hypothetical protein